MKRKGSIDHFVKEAFLKDRGSESFNFGGPLSRTEIQRAMQDLFLMPEPVSSALKGCDLKSSTLRPIGWGY